MEYVSTREIAVKWQVSLRNVQRLLGEGRVPGAKRCGRSWLIPADSKKPSDPRLARPEVDLAFFPSFPLPRARADAALETEDGLKRQILAADLAYRRGNCEPAKLCYREMEKGDPNELACALLATAAAIASRDYELYHEIIDVQQALIDDARSETERKMFSLPQVMAAVSMVTPSLTPDWVKDCDFEDLPEAVRPYAMYLHIMHLRNIRDFPGIYACAKTMIALSPVERHFGWLDVYLRVLAAAACCLQDDVIKGRKWLYEAMDLGLPHGFIAPFADHLAEFGGLMEECLEQRYPQYLRSVLGLWRESYTNWIDFHNHFTMDNLTVILTPQEQHVARLIVQGSTYAETARRMNLSRGRVKNIVSTIYQKLCIEGRRDLKAFIIP